MKCADMVLSMDGFSVASTGNEHGLSCRLLVTWLFPRDMIGIGFQY